MTALLEIENLRTCIDMAHSTVQAVDGISLSVEAGETLGIVGESGSGKTLTAMSIMRLLPPGGRIASGSIRVCGRDVVGMSQRRLREVRGRDVAMVFQDPMTSLNPTMTIGDQIAEPVRAHNQVSKSAAMARALEVLDLVRMPRPAERLRAFPHQLSGGLRQRAMIAIALACSPKLLIADEPTTALDVTIQDQILSLLDDLKSQLDMGLVLITHDLGVIARRADRVVVMYAGRLVETATVSDLFARMRHPYTQALLESVPSLEMERSQRLYSIPGLPPDLSDPPFGCRFAARCRYVQSRCRTEDPELTNAGAGHSYACFFPVSGLRVPEPAIVAEGAITTAQPAEAAPAADDVRNHGGEHVLLSIERVVKKFPIVKGLLRREVGAVQAVSDVSLALRPGETFGLVGESGCGKTTLGRLIVGLDKPDSGRILFEGADRGAGSGAALRAHRRDVQLMFQDPYASLDPRMRVESILLEPLHAQAVGDRRSRRARVRELLEEVGLPSRALELYPHEFSGGQRQRIGLARALTLEPRLVVADEPVSALDVSIQSQILNLMRRLQVQRGLTYIVISHDLSVVRYLSDRVGVMYLGKLVEVGSVAEIYDHPAHPYTEGLLQSIPTPDPAREGQRRAAAVRGELPSAADPPSGCRFRTRCARAQEICAVEEPRLRSFNALSHQAACHFPLQTPISTASTGDERAGADLA